MSTQSAAPEWQTSQWLNTPMPLSLNALRGRPIMVTAFQMLCPSCVSHSLPQAQKVRSTFREEDLAVIGLHTVFEHHAAMGAVALEAFLHEYRIGLPVGVDAPGEGGDPLPRTMRAYGMNGTPTTLLFDRNGGLVRHAFGHLPDLQLGAELALLIAGGPVVMDEETPPDGGANCTADGCPVVPPNRS